MQGAVTDSTGTDGMVTRVTEVGTAVGHVVAGFFIVLFSTYFFLADGDRIWAWLVRLAPRAARERVDASGRVAWVSLTQFVRATVLVALADAIGIMLVAWFLDVPFVVAIGVLVFLGAFVPMIGATVAGSVAILVALVDQGPWTAVLMLIGVIVVQQIEGHVLQPFLMGRFVSLHPLGRDRRHRVRSPGGRRRGRAHRRTPRRGRQRRRAAPGGVHRHRGGRAGRRARRRPRARRVAALEHATGRRPAGRTRTRRRRPDEDEEDRR